MEQNIQLEVNETLVDRLARSFVSDFNRLDRMNQHLVREYVHDVLMSEWREQQNAPDFFAGTPGE